MVAEGKEVGGDRESQEEGGPGRLEVTGAGAGAGARQGHSTSHRVRPQKNTIQRIPPGIHHSNTRSMSRPHDSRTHHTSHTVRDSLLSSAILCIVLFE